MPLMKGEKGWDGMRWDWLLRRLCLLRLTPFPSARRGGTSELHCTQQGVVEQPLLFWMGLATTQALPAPFNAFPFRSPQGHFRSLKVSLTPLFVVYGPL